MYHYQFEKENCWYKEVCNKVDTEKCNKNCLRYMEMDYLMETSHIPKANQFKNTLVPDSKDLKAFTELNSIKFNINQFVSSGSNLYIFSKHFGNGKTTWAIKLMQRYFNNIWAGNGFQVRGLFIHTPSFLTKFKEVINKKDEDFEILKNQIASVDLVVWDDIASGKLSDYDFNNLLTYIDKRKLDGKSNIYTGNLNEDELINAVGNRLKSRIWNDSVVVEFIGNDRRGVPNIW